jgi:hypothetical protein
MKCTFKLRNSEISMIFTPVLWVMCVNFTRNRELQSMRQHVLPPKLQDILRKQGHFELSFNPEICGADLTSQTVTGCNLYEDTKL